MLSRKILQALLNNGTFLSVGLMVSLGIVTANTGTLLALPTKTATTPSTPANLAGVKQSSSPLVDGVYLYGQSAKPEQLGQEYLVFKVSQGKVIGALYLPQSEFNCFSGTISSQRLNLSIVDPYDNTTYAHAIALQDSPVAARGQLPRAVGLEGYHQLTKISSNDQHILNTCLTQIR